jgi:hypothetical protein
MLSLELTVRLSTEQRQRLDELILRHYRVMEERLSREEFLEFFIQYHLIGETSLRYFP